MNSDLAIAQACELRPIREIAARLNLTEEEIDPYGKYFAKISLDVLRRPPANPACKYIVVTCITPTPLGEGKTVNTIGLALGLNQIGKLAIATLRQPSLGPVFGIKGGAAGGGYAQVVPMEQINLHLTGDNHAVAVAHNLLAAFLDNSLYQQNPLGIDLHRITWKRVVDVSDRALRSIIVGLGGRIDGVPRESGFDIAVASEVMAILALTSGLQDLRQRLGRIVVAETRGRQPITAENLRCAGAMTVLLKEALKPNLLQTLEHTPCLMHAGPFGNIAHGNNSILADEVALRLGDYVVTESGFGADLGFEKFVNIKCRTSGRRPDAALLVCTVRALKMHSGRFRIVPGKPLDPALTREDLDSLAAGGDNLAKQIENVRLMGVPVVVAINHFASDTPREIDFVKRLATDAGVSDAVVSEVHAQGGRGGIAMAEAIAAAAEQPSEFRFLYPDDLPIKEKVLRIATKVYGAETVKFLPEAEEQIAHFTELGYGTLPICMAKTHLSLSHDPALKGRPKGFALPVREVRASVGAGFLYPLVGEMRTMPGLPAQPGGMHVDIDTDGRTVGLF